jgi:ribosome-associated protein
MKKNTTSSTEQLVEEIVNSIQDVKGENIKSLDLRKVPNAVADFFIVCHGNSHTQVQAIARRIDDNAEKNLGETPWHKEGIQNAEWVLLDYSDVVVHIFYREAREFYAIEELWADAITTEFAYNV